MRRAFPLTSACKADQHGTPVLRAALLGRDWHAEERHLARRLCGEQPAARIATAGCPAKSEPKIHLTSPHLTPPDLGAEANLSKISPPQGVEGVDSPSSPDVRADMGDQPGGPLGRPLAPAGAP